jgi:hypothetical protein
LLSYSNKSRGLSLLLVVAHVQTSCNCHNQSQLSMHGPKNIDVATSPPCMARNTSTTALPVDSNLISCLSCHILFLSSRSSLEVLRHCSRLDLDAASQLHTCLALARHSLQWTPRSDWNISCIVIESCRFCDGAKAQEVATFLCPPALSVLTPRFLIFRVMRSSNYPFPIS